MMSLVVEFIIKVPKEERKDARQYLSTLYEIFQTLEKKGYLRITLREHMERTKFVNIMKDLNRLFSAYNMLFNVFGKKGNSTRFAQHNKEEFGFDEDNVAYLFLSESISMFLRSAELFKNCFLFILKTNKQRSKDGFWSRMTLGALIKQLDKATSGKSASLTVNLDVNLRNALAHCLFWLEGSVLVYYEDVTLQERKEIMISELWARGRKHSLIAQCLINLIADWYVGT
jgi:hypothetical protein